MRQWGLKDKLDALDAELGKLKDPGGRRWYVNGQGQTFAVIAGPVEFRMGAPADEPERIGGGNDNLRTRMAIPRRFAIATTEVTIPSSRSSSSRRQPATAARATSQVLPDPDGPWIAPDLVHGGPLLQLAERAGGSAQRPVVLLPAEEGATPRG